jgi:endonuclease/exonuclease/phosphatase family metal-dependent hydrolase
MRIITWNMGCAFGWKYRSAHADAWRTVEDLNPDVALLQETGTLPDWVDRSRIIAVARNPGGAFHTVVYVRHGRGVQIPPVAGLAAMLGGQVVLAEIAEVAGSPIVVGSVHTRTGPPAEPELGMFAALSVEERTQLALPEDSGSWNATIIQSAIAAATSSGRFVIGGDFNLAWRFDEVDSGLPRHWAAAQFRAMRDAGWRRPHLKFHAGEERTFFRGSRELFQLDHFFTDQMTYDAATRCEVIRLDELGRLSDHAPLLLEIDGGAVA